MPDVKNPRLLLWVAALSLVSLAFTWPGQKKDEPPKNKMASEAAAKTAAKTVANGSAAPAMPQTSVKQIEDQLNEILTVNENLKKLYAEHVAEIQRVTEEARIHKQILQSLEAVKAAKNPISADTQELLRQEKIRLIQQETDKNRQFLHDLNNGKSSNQR